MKKPIGFRSYQNDEEPDKRDELEKQQAERQKAIANFIGQNYSPIGTTSQKSYKTTANRYMSCRTLSMSLRWRWPNNWLMPGTM